MDILVTGGAGYIGGTVTQAAVEGWAFKVTVYDNLRNKQDFASGRRSDAGVGDIGDAELLEKVMTAHALRWRDALRGADRGG
jgi:UDP-glucose 4-epimerase